MAQTYRRASTPSAAQSTPASPAPTDNPAPPTESTPTADDHMPLEEIVAGGSNALDTLIEVLGSENALTDDVAADCREALRTLDVWLRELPRRRLLLLHALYSRAPDTAADRWQWVGYQIGRPKATVHGWAHDSRVLRSPEC